MIPKIVAATSLTTTILAWPFTHFGLDLSWNYWKKNSLNKIKISYNKKRNGLNDLNKEEKTIIQRIMRKKVLKKKSRKSYQVAFMLSDAARASYGARTTFMYKNQDYLYVLESK